MWFGRLVAMCFAIPPCLVLNFPGFVGSGDGRAGDDADDGKNFMNNQNNEVRVMRAARRRQSLTQLDLARLVGCSEAMVSRMETGRTYADAELKARVAEVLGIETWEVGV